MIITGILQVRNEEISGHLARFLKWNSQILDNLIAYDDCSTDQTFELLKNHGATVIQGSFGSFQSELQIKNSLLKEALCRFPNTDWFLCLDADELLLESREKLETILHTSEDFGYDGISLPLVNLWRSELDFRTDSGFDDLKKVHLWKNTGKLNFIPKPGLHHLMHPEGIENIRIIEDLRVLHFGFSSDVSILNKFQTYQKSGQRGRNLWRLVNESGLVLESILKYVDSLGERFSLYYKTEAEKSARNDSRLLVNDTRLQLFERENQKPPVVTLISLIYAGVDWLEFQYGELLKLKRELNEGEVEILFVANDASREVLDFLDSNSIPYVSAPGRTNDSEWYINSVYRAYNFGVKHSKGDYVLLTNSDMAYYPGFLIQLLKNREPNSYLVGKLIESGRLKPAKPALKKNLGKKISKFKRRYFYRAAEKLLQDEKFEGGLFMPLLISRRSFLEAGGYPEGNILLESLETYQRTGDYKVATQSDSLVPGDFAFVSRLKINGWTHETLKSAIAYHFQEGEKSETNSSFRSRVKSGISVEINAENLAGQFNSLWMNKRSINPRLKIIDSIERVKEDGKYVLFVNDTNSLAKLNTKNLLNISSCITSKTEILEILALKMNMHVYFTDDFANTSSSISSQVLDEILRKELEFSFLPTEPIPFRLVITQRIPSGLKRLVKLIVK